MTISSINQPEVINVSNELRLRKPFIVKIPL